MADTIVSESRLREIARAWESTNGGPYYYLPTGHNMKLAGRGDLKTATIMDAQYHPLASFTANRGEDAYIKLAEMLDKLALECLQSGGMPNSLCQCSVCFSARCRKAEAKAVSR